MPQYTVSMRKLKYNYTVLNRKIYDNQLPNVKNINFKIKNLEAWGLCDYKNGEYTLFMNPKYGSYTFFMEILAHEMLFTWAKILYFKT
jgi:hypothetical protein